MVRSRSSVFHTRTATFAGVLASAVLAACSETVVECEACFADDTTRCETIAAAHRSEEQMQRSTTDQLCRGGRTVVGKQPEPIPSAHQAACKDFTSQHNLGKSPPIPTDHVIVTCSSTKRSVPITRGCGGFN